MDNGEGESPGEYRECEPPDAFVERVITPANNSVDMSDVADRFRYAAEMIAVQMPSHWRRAYVAEVDAMYHQAFCFAALISGLAATPREFRVPTSWRTENTLEFMYETRRADERGMWRLRAAA